MAKRKAGTADDQSSVLEMDIEECEGLTPQTSILSIRAACMYRFLNQWMPLGENIPSTLITGNLLLWPIVGSFISDRAAKDLFDDATNKYYTIGKKPTLENVLEENKYRLDELDGVPLTVDYEGDYDGKTFLQRARAHPDFLGEAKFALELQISDHENIKKYKKVFRDYLDSARAKNVEWNEMNPNKGEIQQLGIDLNIHRLHNSEGSHNEYLLSARLMGLYQKSMNIADTEENIPLDFNDKSWQHKNQLYVEWNEGASVDGPEGTTYAGVVKAIPRDNSQESLQKRIRSLDPEKENAYFTVIYGKINIFKLLGAWETTALIKGTRSTICERYFSSSDYPTDWKRFEEDTLWSSGEIYVTFPFFQANITNIGQTMVSPTIHQETINEKVFGVWTAVWDSTLQWYGIFWHLMVDWGLKRGMNMDKVKKTVSVRLSGASLGATQCNVAALILMLEGWNPKNIRFYGFGGPCAGNSDFVKLLDSYGTQHMPQPSMNLINLRFASTVEGLYAEYDPFSKFPYKENGFVPLGNLFGIESGVIFRPKFGVYENQRYYNPFPGGNTEGIPIVIGCRGGSNIHTGNSNELETLIGDRYMTYTGQLITAAADSESYFGDVGAGGVKKLGAKGNEREWYPINEIINLVKYPCWNTRLGPRLGMGLVSLFFKMHELAGSAVESVRSSVMGPAPPEDKPDRGEVQSFRRATRTKAHEWVINAIPEGTSYYKAMKVAKLENMLTSQSWPLTWYGTLESAQRYSQFFGPVFAFITTNTLNMLDLSNIESIEKLNQLFESYKDSLNRDVTVSGKKYRLKEDPAYLFRVTVGYKISCDEVERFRQKFMSETHFPEEQLLFVNEICQQLTASKQPIQRFSIYELDQLVYKNMCYLIEQVVGLENIHGYSMKPLPTAFGVFAEEGRLFPEEILMCKGGNEYIKHNPDDVHDYMNRQVLPGAESLSVLTFNIHYFSDSNMTNIASLITATGVDVICLQENIQFRKEGESGITFEKIMIEKGYTIVSQCGAQNMGQEMQTVGIKLTDLGDPVKNWWGVLSNSIYVKNTLVEETTFHLDFKLYTPENENPNKPDIVDRCASIATIKGVVIANVHLTGGGYEDKNYFKAINTKKKQVEQVLNTFSPDIILGDFNSEFDSDLASAFIDERFDEGDLARLKSQRGGTNAITRYKKYYSSWTELFKDEGGYDYYSPAYTEREIGPTSDKGGNPDWIIYNTLTLRKSARSTLFKGLGDDGQALLSDHNGIIAYFKGQDSAMAGPSRAGPSTAGPSTAGPSRAGPSTAGPSRAGPSTAGPSRAGPSTAGPSRAGPSTAGPSRAGPSRAGPSTAGPSSVTRSWTGKGKNPEGYMSSMPSGPPPGKQSSSGSKSGSGRSFSKIPSSTIGETPLVSGMSDASSVSGPNSSMRDASSVSDSSMSEVAEPSPPISKMWSASMWSGR
jgi:endonuclease/exonuclease/phosphatase family metal-dependent hydrolase